MAKQYHSIVGKYLTTVSDTMSPVASFTLRNLKTYIAVLEQANLGLLGLSKHMGGLTMFAECLKQADPPNAAT